MNPFAVPPLKIKSRRRAVEAAFEVGMGKDRLIITEQRQRDVDRAALGFGIGTLMRTSTVLMRRIFGAVAPGAARSIEDQAKSTRKPLPSPNRYFASFVAIAVVPSFLCIVYLAFIASDQYVAEARFAVRTAQFDLDHDRDKGTSALAKVGGLAVPAIANQDAYIISNYINSRAVIDDLADKIDIRAIFQRPEADFLARLKKNASAEELTDYWKKMILAYVDNASGIVTLTVRTFRPGDSETLAKAILDASEKLANEVSARSRLAIMRDAEAEVRLADDLVRASLLDMRKFRDTQGFIDPGSAATSTSTLLTQAMLQKIQLESDYFVATKVMSSTAPSVTGLKTRLDAVDAQITQLKSQLTGDSPEGRTISASLVIFEELELKRIFAEKLYSMAEDELERAKLQAENQNIYVSTFVEPSLPEGAKYPERLNLSLTLPVVFFMLWAILAMLAASIEDHRN